MRISANLGFLFRDRPLPDAIRAAKATGFSAVEAHWPYEYDAEEIARVLAETGLPLLGINTVPGDVSAGSFGLSAVPGREAEARVAIDHAVEWAAAAGCRNIHVMAGKAEGPRAFDTFVANLAHAADRAAPHGIGLLIEPINPRDVPGYFLADMATAMRLVEATGGAVRIMFDCYHMQIIQGDLLNTVRAFLSAIGHVQFAGVPDRAEPDAGEVAYDRLLPAIREAGYDGHFGAEYKPRTGSLDWLGRFVGRR